MKKIIIILMALMTLLIMNANATPVVTANSTSNLGVDTWTVQLTLNESSNASYYVATDSGYTTFVDLQNATASVSHSFDTNNNNIDVNTLYYYRVNGTDAVSGLVYVMEGSITTNQNVISGSGRAIMRLFVLIVLGVIMVGVVAGMNKGDNLDPKKLLITLAGAMLGIIILFGFVTAVLGL